ncbi:MAG: type II toxin-antitoxin system VapC family toxin [Puniceicoccaceae bacterium]|nr:MAG: type II toxin-antitoxin system VapC family toxin [Puniceicoccaceae bacterium]
MKAVFDTNILIDYLNGIEAARDELARYSIRQISIITYIEVMVGATRPAEAEVIRSFLGSFESIELSSAIARETIALRQAHRLKVPDAIVYATARTQACLLVTRNTKDLKTEWADIRVPYQI